MTDTLPCAFSGIQNIKLLNNYRDIIKENLKRDTAIVKTIEKVIKDQNKKLEVTNRKAEIIINDYKRKKRLVCTKCGAKVLNKEVLRTHSCNPYFRCYFEHIDVKLHILLRTSLICKTDIKEKKDRRDKAHQNIIYNKEQLQKIDDRIKMLYMKCQNCFVKTELLEKCNCTHNHYLCKDCHSDTNKCPVCLQIISSEICPICMNKKDLIDTACGNGHKICGTCMINICCTSSKCPFCRNDIIRFDDIPN